MKIRIPAHTETNLLLRDIDISRVRSVIKSPDHKESTYQERTKARKLFEDGKEVEVIYKKHSKNQITIITAYYL